MNPNTKKGDCKPSDSVPKKTANRSFKSPEYSFKTTQKNNSQGLHQKPMERKEPRPIKELMEEYK